MANQKKLAEVVKNESPSDLGPHQDLGEVAVSVLLSILSLQVLLLYQDVDAFLDHWDFRLKPGLISESIPWAKKSTLNAITWKQVGSALQS